LTTLYNFCSQSSCSDGNAARISFQAIDGDLYGVAGSGGGANSGGTIFRMTLGGKLKTLYSFCALDSSCPDGSYPTSLVQATDGNFYGTTIFGGAYGYGTIFQFNITNGQLTTLHNFCTQAGCSDGANPIGGLVQDTNGTFYGTASAGGNSSAPCSDSPNGITTPGCGTVYSLSMGFGPFVATLPTSGKVGATIKILGTSLKGASTVTFNGVPASTFKVVSASEISTTVPTGATTGPVQVVTPKGTLSSNVSFRVQ
jgi:uncharacterized repeat protein (TIGR03803 family)